MKIFRRPLDPVLIETERFTIRNINPLRFARQTLDWCSDTEMMLNMGWTIKGTNLHRWWRHLRKLENGNRRCVGIWPRGEKQPIGLRWVQFYPVARVGMINAMIGAKSWRGRGAYSETSRAFVDYWFSNFQVERLYAQTKANNAAVIHTLQQIGFQLEGRLRRQAVNLDGTRVDMIELGLLREEWESAAPLEGSRKVPLPQG